MKNFKIILVLLSVIILISGCSLASTSTITGTWKVTYTLNIFISTGTIYEFSGTDSVKTGSKTGTYTLDANGILKMTIDSKTYKAYILGRYMYWYVNNIETYRFEKQ